MEKNKVCLILTGTIQPLNVPNLNRDNYLEREQDYYNGIQYWMKFNLPLIFCENSNYNSKSITNLIGTNNPDIEVLQFHSKSSLFGKGHGEADIFKYIQQNSILYQLHEKFCKISGRYVVSNFNKINHLLEGSYYICSNLSSSMRWADSRFFFFTKDFFEQYFLPNLELLDEKNRIYMENILARSISKALSDGQNFQLLPLYPNYSAIDGTSNIHYRDNFYSRLKYKFYWKLKTFIFKKAI
ncbi:MAG: hypothetical protein ABI761_12690 [Saprospiraceae bacterium]